MGALTLRRKLGKSILVGNDIRITITRLQNGWADVRIQAPDSIKIQREENAPEFRNCDHG